MMYIPHVLLPGHSFLATQSSLNSMLLPPKFQFKDDTATPLMDITNSVEAVKNKRNAERRFVPLEGCDLCEPIIVRSRPPALVGGFVGSKVHNSRQASYKLNLSNLLANVVEFQCRKLSLQAKFDETKEKEKTQTLDPIGKSEPGSEDKMNLLEGLNTFKHTVISWFCSQDRAASSTVAPPRASCDNNSAKTHEEKPKVQSPGHLQETKNGMDAKCSLLVNGKTVSISKDSQEKKMVVDEVDFVKKSPEKAKPISPLRSPKNKLCDDATPPKTCNNPLISFIIGSYKSSESSRSTGSLSDESEWEDEDENDEEEEEEEEDDEEESDKWSETSSVSVCEEDDDDDWEDLTDSDDNWGDKVDGDCTINEDNSDNELLEFSFLVICQVCESVSCNSKCRTGASCDQEACAEESTNAAAIKEANAKWDLAMNQYSCEPRDRDAMKVSFAPEETLVSFTMVEGSDTLCRKGEWEQFARDRLRFKERIARTDKTISRCFEPEHRRRMYRMIHGSEVKRTSN